MKNLTKNEFIDFVKNETTINRIKKSRLLRYARVAELRKATIILKKNYPKIMAVYIIPNRFFPEKLIEKFTKKLNRFYCNNVMFDSKEDCFFVDCENRPIIPRETIQKQPVEIKKKKRGRPRKTTN